MKKVLLVGLVIVVVGALIGCGIKTEVTRYYWGPSWTRDGKVILVGATETRDKDALGSQLDSSYSEYVMTVYPSGTGESSALFETTEEPAYAMSCSPTSDYVAYMTDLRNGLFRKLIIRNIASGTHTGLEVVELSFSPGIKAFDWSNDGTKLVYCTTTEVRTVDIDGTNDALVVADTELEFVSWKYGTMIAFVRNSGANKLLSLIDPSGTTRVNLNAATSVDLPQISSANTDEVYGVVGNAYKKVNVNTSTVSDVVASGFEGILPRISPDATRLTYSKSNEASGVYVLVITTEAESKVK